MSPRETAAMFTISVAATITGMHAQTLRQYDRLGIVVPQRTRGGGRRYSSRDVRKLREVQRLSVEEGINLAGIRRILSLENQLEELEEENSRLRAVADPGSRVFHAATDGDVVALPRGRRWEDGVAVERVDTHEVRREVSQGAALVLWRPRQR